LQVGAVDDQLMRFGDQSPVAAAIAYAHQGWKVVPLHTAPAGRCTCGRVDCESPGKHPRTPHGSKDASSDETTISAWWERWPDSNLGIVPDPRIAVLDVDPRNGGDDSLADLERDYGRLPTTAAVATGGGGRHFYFRLPEGEFRKRPGFRPGLDLLIGTSYVIAPPSVHASGGDYYWVTRPDEGIAPIPSWLVEVAGARYIEMEGRAADVAEERIVKGRRHTSLVSHGGTMRRRAMPAAAIEAALLEENRQLCDPPLNEDEVRGIARGVSKYPIPDESRAGPRRQGTNATQSTLLVELASVAELFHTPDGKAFATIPIRDHPETHPLRSRAFRVWLARRFYLEEGKAPGSQAIQSALDVLEGQAIHDGPEIPVYTRLAELEGKIYLDLANETWEVVETGPEGWRILAESPVKFRRTRAMLAMPRPEAGSNVAEFFGFVNVCDEADRVLLLAAVIAALRPRGPYPVLVFHGEQGSAKSTSARLVSALVDPSRAGLRAEPRDVRDLMIAAINSHALAFDNVSSLPAWLSDALCRLATGGAFTTRELYSDQEETILEAQRPVILTGIEVPVTRSDLLDRALIIQLPSIPDASRRPEELLMAEFEAARPRLLGAFLSAVSAALKKLPGLELASLPRMSDFARWASAAEEALGLAPGAFMRAYALNRQAANDVALEASPIAAPVIVLIDDVRSWTGALDELRKALEQQFEPGTEKPKGWPASARGMRSALERAAPNLRIVGIEVTFLPRCRNGRPVRLERIGGQPSQPTHPSPDLFGRPGEMTDGAGAPSSATSRDGGIGDGGDGGDGCLQTRSSATRGGDEANAPRARPETLQEPSEPGSGDMGDQARRRGLR